MTRRVFIYKIDDCLYAFDLFGVDYLDCNGNCLSDVDEDGVW